MFFVPFFLILVCLAEIVAVVGEPHTGQEENQQAQQREGDGNDNRLDQGVPCAFLYHVVENKKIGNQSGEQKEEHPPSPILRREVLQRARYISTDDKGDNPHSGDL